ncbi:hypothetical protein [Verrucosispora sp. NA02020]|uniref:hypothetical protein n=1 Tax=Verrucosispora sp. NA02020 TaxID=2742132 RepID=UPI003D703B1A
MAAPIIRVTAEDIDSGEGSVAELESGGFVVICAEPMYVAHEQRHQNGTVVLTLKRREPA